MENKANSTVTWVLKQIEMINSPMGYMLLAVIVALIALLAIFYAFLTALLNRQNHSQNAYKDEDMVIFEQQQEALLYPMQSYAPRNKWQRGTEEWDSIASNIPTTEMEKIYRQTELSAGYGRFIKGYKLKILFLKLF